MRTAETALEEIKKVDPGTAITVSYLRRMIKAKAVPVLECGRKKLVNVDALMEVLASGYQLPREEKQPEWPGDTEEYERPRRAEGYGKIRRVD